MLKKLEFFRQTWMNDKPYISVQDNVILTKSIEDEIQRLFLDSTIRSIYTGNACNEGRSSFCFWKYSLINNRTFLKANVPGKDDKAVLRKEYEIYLRLYHDVVIGFYDISDELGIMEMRELIPCKVSCSVEYARALIESNTVRLNGLQLPDNSIYDISRVLNISRREIVTLKQQNLLSSSYDLAQELLNELDDRIRYMPRIMCHGDYGDTNVLEDRCGHPIIIDWEDAFWGVRSYDYLYWLSFFSHRHYYSTHLFGKDQYERRINISILVMVLIIKEAMSFYTGEYKRHRMTTDERVAEILDLL